MKSSRVRAIEILAWTSLAISVAVIFGWALDIESLKTVLPGYISMKINTALSFAMIATNLLLIRFEFRQKSLWTSLLSFFVILLSGATLVEYLGDWNLGIDEIFKVDVAGIDGRFPPGRLAPITALNFIFLAIAFLCLNGKSRKSLLASQSFSALVFFASFQAMIGYLLGVSYLYGSAFYTQMAVHTAVSFIFLSIGCLLLTGEHGLMRCFTSKSATSRMTRWMFVSTAFVPLLLRSLAQLGYKRQLYDQDFAQLFQVVGITVLMVIIVCIIGLAMFSKEEESFKKQKSLTEAEQRFQILANGIPQMTWITDEDGLINWYNQRWFDYTGTTFEEVKGAGWKSVHHPDHLPRVQQKFSEHLLSGLPWEDTFPIRSASGEWRWFLSRAMPIRGSDGTVTSWFGTNTDITENLKTESELRESRELAEAANLTKTQFLANMSHEIRTPVGAIIGFTDLMKNPSTSVSDRSGYLDIIERNSKNLLRLVDDILDLSKIESGKIAIEMSQFYLLDLIFELNSSLRLRASQKGISFQIQFDGALPEQVLTDSLRVRQILTNLVGNAIKFTEVGSVNLMISFQSPFLIFTVRDSGIGIESKDIPKLFQKFGQGDPSMSRRFGGSGLGLILSRRLSEALGGELNLKESAPQVGSVFEAKIKLDLPDEVRLLEMGENLMGPKTLLRSTVKKTPLESSLEGLRVLLVEDSPDNQVLIQLYLKKAGALVELAENGWIGYQKALSQQPDIVLMDVQMAVMDGNEATRKLRAEGFTQPIIALTAHAMREDRDRCLEAGCTDYLTKPISKENLVQTLCKFSKVN